MSKNKNSAMIAFMRDDTQEVFLKLGIAADLPLFGVLEQVRSTLVLSEPTLKTTLAHISLEYKGRTLDTLELWSAFMQQAVNQRAGMSSCVVVKMVTDSQTPQVKQQPRSRKGGRRHQLFRFKPKTKYPKAPSAGYPPVFQKPGERERHEQVTLMMGKLDGVESVQQGAGVNPRVRVALVTRTMAEVSPASVTGQAAACVRKAPSKPCGDTTTTGAQGVTSDDTKDGEGSLSGAGSDDEWEMVGGECKQDTTTSSKTDGTFLIYVNGQRHELYPAPDPSRRLVDFLRVDLQLTGTKIGCGEGGCGACTVVLASQPPDATTVSYRSANSCLRPLLACDGMAVTTVEGLQSRDKGKVVYHPITTKLAQDNGTQCGYCSNGMVMNMYGLQQQQRTDTALEIEANFDGNICRCTGYRPIMTAMHSFAKSKDCKSSGDAKHSSGQKRVDAPCSGSVNCRARLTGAPHCTEELCRSCDNGTDVEEVVGCAGEHKTEGSKCCGNNQGCGCDGGDSDSQPLIGQPAPFPKELVGYRSRLHGRMQSPGKQLSAAPQWHKPTSLQDLLQVLQGSGTGSGRPRLVVGNTAHAVWKYYTYNAEFDSTPSMLVDITAVDGFTDINPIEGGLEVGAAVTLDALQGALRKLVPPSTVPSAAQVLVDHMQLIANKSVRNCGGWAGNLMLRKTHPGFASDLATILAGVNAQVCIGSPGTPPSIRWWSVSDFITDTVTLEKDHVLTRLRIPLPTPPPSQSTATATTSSENKTAATGAGVYFNSYKSMGRHCNSHPLINMAVWCELKDATNGAGLVFSSVRVCVGGNRAFSLWSPTQTITSLTGAPVSLDTINTAIQTFATEASPPPTPAPPKGQDRLWIVPSAAYRQQVSTALFYRYMLWLAAFVLPGAVPANLSTGGQKTVRGVSSGTEVFTPDQSEAPVSEPVNKLEGLRQCSGEALYVDDEALRARCKYAAYVYSTIAKGEILSIDASAALAMPGVMAFVSAKDIASIGGSNNCGMFPGDEEIFASTHIGTYGQAVGMVVADSQVQADAAALQVAVSYKSYQRATAFPDDRKAQASPPPSQLSEHNKHNNNNNSNNNSYSSGQDERKESVVSGMSPGGVPMEHTPEFGRLVGDTSPPVYTIDQAIAAGSYLQQNQWMQYMDHYERGDISGAFSKSAYVMEGEIYNRGQAHFYMETQACWVSPTETNGLKILSATQDPAGLRGTVCNAIGASARQVEVTTRRSGGGFGGKGTRSHVLAAALAVCVRLLGVPVACQNDRWTDMIMSGKRHSYLCKYKVGCDENGKILGYSADIWNNGGYTYDASFGSMTMCLQWADGAYYFPAFKVRGVCCKTNTATNTSCRGPGAMNASFFTETVVDQIASVLKISPNKVREANFYSSPSQMTPYGQPVGPISMQSVWSTLLDQSKYTSRLTQVLKFNQGSRWKKRGLYCSALKYGISWVGYMNTAIINIDADDGSVELTHTGCEIGQGINTKAAQVLVYKLNNPSKSVTGVPSKNASSSTATTTSPGQRSRASNSTDQLSLGAVRGAVHSTRVQVRSGGSAVETKRVSTTNTTNTTTPTSCTTGASTGCGQAGTGGLTLDMVQVGDTSTSKVPNFGPTGGSGTSECVCVAVERAADIMNARLAPYRAKYPTASWTELIGYAAQDAVDLQCHGYYCHPDEPVTHPFDYYVYGAACSEVEVDVMTGEVQVLSTDIVFDCGQSLNPAVDVGQVEGSFVMGMGQYMTENLVISPETGRVISCGTWEYKPPSALDIPINFNVTFLNQKNTVVDNVLSSKASGEPPMLLSASVVFAIKHAIASFRQEELGDDSPFTLHTPLTVEAIQQACQVSTKTFKL